MIYRAANLVREWPQANIPGTNWWVPVRPLDGGFFWRRLQAAWGVLTGRYDALDWSIPAQLLQQQEKTT